MIPVKRLLFIIIVVCFGFISTGLLTADETGQKIDQLAAKLVKPGAPGFALAIVKDGKIVHKNGYGLAHLDYDVPITPRTVFYMGSVSKQFVAFAVVLLEAKGKLGFDDDIHKYIPELPDYGSTITIRHLIHHTGGIRGYLMLLDLGGLDFDHYHTGSDVIKHILTRQKNLDFKPGERYKYSNSGYLILAETVKRVSGMSFREFTQKNILDPLGMKNSHFLDDYSEVVKHRAISYRRDKKKGYKTYVSRFDLVGSGGLYATVEDLFHWDQNFYHGKVGGEAAINTMLTRGKLNNGEELDYAFGLVHGTYKGLKTVGHTGGLFGYRAYILRFPGQRFSVFVISNDGGFNTVKVARGAADMYLAKEIKQAAEKAAKDKKKSKKKKKLRFVKLSRKHLDNKTGAYRNPKNGNMVTVKVKENQLAAAMGNTKMVLSPVAKNRFKIVKPEVDIMVHFVRKGKDKTSRFAVESRDLETGKLRDFFEPVTAAKPTEEYLQQYTGAYSSEELNVTYTFVVRDGKLYVEFRTGPDTHLKPTIKDEFLLWGAFFRFTRDDTGKVAGFNLINGNVTPIPFEKLK
jgi:CubicO group peptidase (beta-lactamase class C family)